MTTASPYSGQELRLLQLLSSHYPTIEAAHVAMISLEARLSLPKGTDHYLSDIHGAYDQFDHILRHASGAIRRYISQSLGESLSAGQQVALAMLVYYPEQVLPQEVAAQPDAQAWMVERISHLARVARSAGHKYTRRQIRERLTPSLAPIIEELLVEGQTEPYTTSLVRAIVALGEGEALISALAALIRSLVVARLFILGDIYDRGPAAERVMDRLMASPSVSIQWGNHDVSWMAAASGGEALLANVMRIALRYATLETLLDGYGLNLRALARFADATYAGDPCDCFRPHAGQPLEEYPPDAIARMHKAITMIQFKLEAQLIQRHPEYQMADRLLLDAIDLTDGTVTVQGVRHPLRDTHWPTLQPHDRAALTTAEAAVMDDLRAQFQRSERLQTHIRFLYSYGNMYEVQDGNLKFHGCLPVDERGEFVAFPLGGEWLAGPPLLERYEQLAREAFFSSDPVVRQAGQDAMWYLWCGPQSPLFGRQRMTTFERYLVADPATHEEPKGPYYVLRDSEAFCRKVLGAFGADVERGYIINGHTPVRAKQGERPLLAGGRLLVIDGGMSEAYQPVTGTAGYTLIANSREMVLAAHEPFSSAEEMVREGRDVTPHTERIELFPHRVHLAETDQGRALRGQLDDLAKLVDAYRRGVLVEQGGAWR